MRPSFAQIVQLLAIVCLTLALGRIVTAANPSPSPSVAPSDAASPGSAKTNAAIVNTVHFAFGPNPLTIAVGTNVTFKNSDEVAHTVTSADGVKPAFDSGDMAQNATWSHIFDKAGTYAYYCTYHTYMKGIVIVK